MTEWLPSDVVVALMSALVIVARSAAIAALAAGAILVMRPPAATRHAIWCAALAINVTLTWMALAGPPGWVVTQWGLPDWMGTRWAGALSVGLVGEPFRGRADGAFVLWASVGAILTLRLLRDALALHRLIGRTTPFPAQASPALESVGRHRTPVALRRSALPIPAVAGLWRPVVLLPAGADTWNEEERRAIVAHELEHVRRRDPLALLLVRLACALCWFDPVCWWIARRIRIDGERACDDAVLGCGVDRITYARLLLDTATAHQRSHSVPVHSLVDRATLPARVRWLLRSGVRRGSRPHLAVALTVVLLLVAGAGLSVVPTGRFLYLLPVRDGTLVVDGIDRLLAVDMWPAPMPSGSAGHRRLELRSIESLRAASEEQPAHR